MNLTVLNDLHLGVQRCAGTTPASALALRNWLMESYTDFINDLPDDETLLLNGDVFDGSTVALSVVGEFISVTMKWLSKPQRRLVMSRGNHDISKDSSNLSSFDFAASILRMTCQNFEAVTEPTAVPGVGYVVPHAANEDIFNHWLEQVPEGEFVFLHANYDNGFSVLADHSLNVSYNQAADLIESRGCTLFFAHEHQAREAFGGRLTVTGNQWASSVADCLGNPCGFKKSVRISDTIRYTTTWDASADFLEVPWRDLPTVNTDARFIRVVGEATAQEAADMVNAIARYRRDSPAFVVSNAVSVEGHQLDEGVEATVESIKAFDPVEFALGLLTEEQQAKIRKLQKEVCRA